MSEHKEFNWWQTQGDKFISAILYPPVFIVLLLTLLSYVGVKLFFTKQEILHIINQVCQ